MIKLMATAIAVMCASFVVAGNDILGAKNMLKKWESLAQNNTVLVVDKLERQASVVEACGNEVKNNTINAMMFAVFKCDKTHIKDGYIEVAVFNLNFTDVRKVKVVDGKLNIVEISPTKSGMKTTEDIGAIQDSYPNHMIGFRRSYSESNPRN